MNQRRIFFPLFLLLALLAPGLSGQVVTKWVAIANGGRFGDPTENAHLLLFDPGSGMTFSPDTVQTQSVQDLLIEGHYAYLAAQDSLVKYDLAKGIRVAAAAFGAPSTIRLGLYRDYLLAGNWYGASSGNFRIFDKHSLALLDTVAGISRGATDFVVYQDSAYVVQNYTTPAFVDSAGYLAVVDLRTRSHVRDIPFANNGEDLGRLLELDGVIYGLNPASNSITAYEVATATSVTLPAGVDIQVRTNGPQTAWKGDTLFFPFNGGVGAWDLKGFGVWDSLVLDTLATALAFDTLNGHFYLTQTDFFSYARGGIWDPGGNKVGSLPVGTAPEAVRVVYNTFPQARNDTFVHPGTDSLYLPVLANDRDEDGDSLEIVILSSPHRGQAKVEGSRILLLQGEGPDSLQYAAVDPWGDADTAWVGWSSLTSLEGKRETAWSVFPNPCKDRLEVQLPFAGQPVTLSLTELTGRVLRRWHLQGAQSVQLEVETLPAGTYLLRFVTEEAQGWKKVVKD